MSTVNVPIPVPASGFGPAVDVSSLVGEKTVILSGRYQGAYVLYGSHDGANFVPLLIFNAGGIESIKQTFSGALSRVKLKSLVSNANGVSASISGLSVPLDNSFTSIGPVGKGLSSAVDLGNNAYQTDLNFMGFGRLNGAVVVEGSSDGMGFNPIGEFSASPSGSSLLGGGGIEFSPIGTKDKVRFVRLNVLGDVDSFLVTIGGAQSDSGGGGGETLADAYLAGVTSVDQTLPISDANGGKVVFDAMGAGFTGHEAVAILSIGRGFYAQYGGLTIGPNNLGIGIAGMSGSYYTSDAPAGFYDPTSVGNVAIGPYADIDAGNYSVAIGSVACYDSNAVAMGSGGTVAALQSVAIGWDVFASSNGVAIGPIARALDDSAVAIGNTAWANHVGDVVIGAGSSTSAFASMTPGNNVVIGVGSSAVDDSNVVIGTSCSSSSAGLSTPTGNNVVIGDGCYVYGADDVCIGNGSQAGTSIYPVIYAIAIGHGSQAGENYGVAIGYRSILDPLAAGSVVVGNSEVAGPQSVVIGDGAFSGTGISNVAIGKLSSVNGIGDANVCVGWSAIGDVVGETRDFHNNVRVGEGENLYGNFSVGIGNNVIIGSTLDPVVLIGCIAIGSATTVTGSEGMAFGTNATAGASEIVFSSSAAGGANKFEVVSSASGNPDLIGLDVASLTGINTTAMTLLIEKSDTSVVAVPVTLSIPDPVTHLSNLQVYNA